MHGLEAHSVTLRSRHTFATALLGEGTRALYQEYGVVGRRDALPAIEHTFIMSMLADRIRAICRENGVLPQRDALPGIEPLWHSFQVYMTYTLAALNSELADRFLIRSSLYQIASLMFTGFHIPDLPWRSHIRGFFALVRHHGGFQAVVDSIPQAIFLFHSVAIAVTMANATSPATDQIAQAKEWTETQYSQAYDYSLSDILPCPTALFLCVGRITNLRVAVANGVSPAALLVSAERTSEKLNLFDPACWTKAFSTVPEPRKVRTVYDTAFKLATILYALLSLPTELSQPFAKMGQKPNPERKEKSKQQQVSEVNQARLHYRKLLFDIVVLGKRRASLVHGCLCWPLAVLGIAYHDGPAETKAAILTVADELRRVPVGSSGPSNILFTLSRFWASGKTRWDECFDTPVHVLL
ncbi:C6 zinc finger domain [Cordyceps militaris]|uniref:C6 zinc finger domain n=1 Tax=Cordyceps militaris TaxID=73501 RepID=A0A2H4SFL6_CORMI|nr:C6 zinc finger domain [Cordyceps militaris]